MLSHVSTFLLCMYEVFVFIRQSCTCGRRFALFSFLAAHPASGTVCGTWLPRRAVPRTSERELHTQTHSKTPWSVSSKIEPARMRDRVMSLRALCFSPGRPVPPLLCLSASFTPRLLLFRVRARRTCCDPGGSAVGMTAAASAMTQLFPTALHCTARGPRS